MIGTAARGFTGRTALVNLSFSSTAHRFPVSLLIPNIFHLSVLSVLSSAGDAFRFVIDPPDLSDKS